MSGETPDLLTMQFTMSLERLDAGTRNSVLRGIQDEDKARHALGVLEQIRLKKLADALMIPGANTEIGRTSMILSPDQYQRAMNRYGELCWADPAFGRWMLKQHSDMRVKDVGTRVQSGYTGESGHAEKLKS